MANSIPVGHYSRLGEQTINRMANDDVEYMNFLKYFGRVFKHPVSVALEFYVNRPEAQFIASGNQWKRAGYQVNPASIGIQFLDQKGAEVTLYDFDDVIGDYPPKRWTITNRNVDAIRNELGLSSDTPLFSALDESAASAIDDLSLIQDLELTDLSNEDKLRFRNSYHNMIQTMIAGRLEINGARYNVQPDRAALMFCKNDEQKLMLLTSASSSARKALTSVEYAFDTLRTENALRKEEQNNDLRTVESSQRRAENTSSRSGISADTERATGERSDRVTSGEEGRTAGLDNSSESWRSGENILDRGNNNEADNIRGNDDRTAISSESVGRTVRPDDTERTVNDGRTGGTVRQNVDAEHGEELSGEGRTDDVLSQLPDSSSVSGQESSGVLRTAEREVGQGQSSSDNGIRSSAAVVENEEVRNRPLGNDGDSSRSGDRSINESIADKWTNIDVFTNSGDDSIDWVYYNPDSTEGGQLVINHLSHDQLKDAARFESPYDYLQSIAKQELIDISAADFADTANYYYDIADNNKALFVCRTGNAKEIEMFINEYTQQLDQLTDKQSYAAYRASLRNTRFTKLNESQIFNYSHSKYVESPENSIWGEVQGSFSINNGIFEVSTASHGGIMIKSEIARIILSKEAQAAAQQENGWYYYEEDSDYAVVKRELLDKGLFDNIDSYFSRQYSRKTEEFLLQFSDSLNDTLQRWHSDYWDSREVALFNALSPEEQAEEIGQLSFADNTADEADDAEAAEIRNHAIETTMDDIRKRIERIEAANGDPNELATQVNMLNFLQTAAEQGVEITSENFKSFVAENGVATSSNVPENYFEIYQLKDREDLHYYWFTDYDTLHQDGNAVEAENYDLIYTAELTSGTTLEDIYTRFNIEHPADFKGHSLSVSDIVVVHDNGETAAYYVDNFGFKKVPEFLQLEHTAEDVVTSNNDNDLEKAKSIINSFCESEYGDEADFSDMHNIGIAFTTLTDDELPVQVTADLIDHKITYEFAGEIYNIEEYSDINDMIENGLTGLDFDELVSVPDDVIEKITAVDTSSNEETAVVTSNNDALTEEKSHKRASRAEMLYREFTAAFPDIANGSHTYERYGDYDEFGENDAFEPLSVESLGDDTFAFMTWYVQNGDLMRDPDFVFTLDHEKQELHVWEFQIDGVPPMGTIYQNVELEDGTIDRQLQTALEESFRKNLRNAVAVGRELSAYTDANGEEHELQEQPEHIAEPEQPDIHDESAYYREVLNEFSEKHGLGELNIRANDNGFVINENFKDGAAVPLWYISKYNAEKPLSVEEVTAELEAFEKTADQNGYTVSDQINHEYLVRSHDGMKELPVVQDNLPEIKYADNPYGKIRDNITAIREMRRMELMEERGDYPYDSGRNSYYSEEACTERLRRYSGWGGVSQVFDERFPAMSNLRRQLREQLSDAEYAAARSSTLNSHYTPQVIIDEMYKTIRNMGLPENSRILEPSCGTGNFITRMPHDMGKGGIVGVELDPITAKIAKHLNVPKHNPYAKKDEAALEDTRDIKILNCGFEKANLENNSFDVVIGNVPFGDYKLNDPDYTNDWLIHDAFFRKALDKVAAGGVVAFITSSGTLDKKNPKVREQLAMRADLIGAVRLPNNAFADADTKVTSDIIFLQKRKTPLNVYDPKPDWCYTAPVEVEMVGKKYEGEKRTAYINSYFAQNPQMVLGTIKQTTHFDMLTCEPNEGRTLQEQLETAFRQLNAKIKIDNRERSNLEKRGYVEPWGKSFTYQIKDNKVYYNLGNAMEEVDGSDKTIEKLKSLCELRDITRELLNKQQSYVLDEELIPLRNKLNAAYDSFVKENGELSSKSVKKLFSLDADYPILDALEHIDPETKKVTKADIFTKRTVSPVAEITEVGSSEEAMQISLDKKGRVDIAYMATLLQNKYENAELSEVMEYITDELLDKGMIFRDPEKIATGKPYAEIVDKSEYLCGNVRRKLVMAETFAEQDSSYNSNVEALKEVIPEEIGAAEISVDLGCTWIDTADYENFMRMLSGRTEYDSRNFGIRFSEITGKFSIENSKTKNISALNPNEISTYGTEDMNMYHILENLLNQKKIQVFDYFPDPMDAKKVKSVLNKNKTQVAQSKAKAIKQKFSEWIFASEERKEKYVKRYNEKFNNLVGRSYDGSHLTFAGMANDFKLRPHQLDCVARTIYGGNTLAAHCVGAGKSAVIAASVMKKKELGLIHKACVVVPKPLTEQTEREWRTSFPDAKLLVVDNKDLSDEKKRELFTARVATGDYDAIIMSQEQYEKLPMSAEHRLEFLNKQKAELLDQLSQSKRENGRRDPTVKEIERAIKAIEVRIEAITNPKSKSRGKDSLLNFESLGFDYLVVDEAHAYKNGFVSTKMGDVSGVNTRESGRAGDMQMKCDYFNSELGNGHILFATGTPVSNSMTELYVMTRYLRPDLLEDCGCARFDDWAATFGQIKTQNKKTATGELKLKTCFAGFKNRPELIKMYKDFADLITIDKITAPDKDGNAPTIVVPNIKTGKPQIIEVEATPEQREIVKDFARRGREIQLGNVRPDEDNLLKITGEARLVGLGNRAVLSVYEKNEWEPPIGFVADDKSGKIDKCIKNVAEIYKDRYDKNAVQIIFSDIAVNSDDGKFSAYEYIRDELIANGVKEDEIIFAPKSDAKNRAEIFRDINEAKYRVVIASTGTLGTGANIQKNLYALHHLDIPWRPSDFEQREGRIVRQGNLNDEVEIFNYVTKGTLDSYLYQGVTDKARGIAQLWNDTCISRTSEDIDEKVLTFGELEAAAEGNPKLRQYSELKNKIDELQVVRAEYNRETTRVERRIKELPETIEAKKSLIAAAKNDSDTAKKMQHNGKLEELKLITHDNRTLTERKHINSYLAKQIQLKIEKPYDDIPSFRVSDFKITVAMSADRAHPDFAIKGERTAAYRLGVGVGDNTDNCQRLMNFFDKGIDKVIEIDTQSVEKDETDLAQAIERAAAKFPSEDDYQETLKAFEELETELSMGGYLDNGEEICGAEDYGTCDTERIDSNTDYDEDDLIQDEYNSTL